MVRDLLAGDLQNILIFLQKANVEIRFDDDIWINVNFQDNDFRYLSFQDIFAFFL